MHAHLLRHAEQAEDVEEDRHQDRPAADAEHAGQQAGDDTRGSKCEDEGKDFGNRGHGGSLEAAERPRMDCGSTTCGTKSLVRQVGPAASRYDGLQPAR